MALNDHAELAVFIAIAEERSFRRAAARLRLTPSTLSHSLRSLEDRLGVRLLNRTTRTVALTEAGADLLADVAPAFRAVAGALERVNAFRDMPRGTVRLTVPRLAGTMLVAPRLATFALSYPDVKLEVNVNDAFVDIVKEGFDAGIRLGESLAHDMVAVRIGGDLHGVIVGSPDYFERHGKPSSPRDLHDHRLINRRHTGSGAVHPWKLAKDPQEVSVSGQGQLTLNSDELITAAARGGVGIAYMSETDVAEDLASGALVSVLGDWCRPIAGWHLYHPENRNVTAALKALIASLTAA